MYINSHVVRAFNAHTCNIFSGSYNCKISLGYLVKSQLMKALKVTNQNATLAIHTSSVITALKKVY